MVTGSELVSTGTEKKYAKVHLLHCILDQSTKVQFYVVNNQLEMESYLLLLKLVQLLITKLFLFTYLLSTVSEVKLTYIKLI
jgi:hypothetical protein